MTKKETKMAIRHLTKLRKLLDASSIFGTFYAIAMPGPEAEKQVKSIDKVLLLLKTNL